jgi:hypothetical protein
MKRILGLVLAVLALGAAVGGAAGTASAGGTSCPRGWGSRPKVHLTGSTGEMHDVRTGRHGCYDRLVIDVDGDLSGYSVRYVDAVAMDGSGAPVPLRGGARLLIVATAPTMSTDGIFLPNGELANVRQYRTFRQVAWAGSFEGQTSIGLGVRARLPFRVRLLDGPGHRSRLIVDVAHHW